MVEFDYTSQIHYCGTGAQFEVGDEVNNLAKWSRIYSLNVKFTPCTTSLLSRKIILQKSFSKQNLYQRVGGSGRWIKPKLQHLIAMCKTQALEFFIMTCSSFSSLILHKISQVLVK